MFWESKNLIGNEEAKGYLYFQFPNKFPNVFSQNLINANSKLPVCFCISFLGFAFGWIILSTSLSVVGLLAYSMNPYPSPLPPTSIPNPTPPPHSLTHVYMHMQVIHILFINRLDSHTLMPYIFLLKR